MSFSKSAKFLLGTALSIIILAPQISLPSAQAATEPFVFVTEWRSQDLSSSIEAGIAVNPSPNGTMVYVTDNVNRRVLQYDGNGTFVREFGKNENRIFYPTDIAVDSNGNVIVLDDQNGVLQFNNDGDFVRSWPIVTGDGTVHTGQQGLALFNDTLYVADTGYGQILVFSLDGTLISTIGSPGTGEGQLSAPNDVAVDSAGNVFVADSQNNRIQKFASDGSFITQWNKYGIEGFEMYNPQSVSIDREDNVIVALGSIHKFSSDGDYLGVVSPDDPSGAIQRTSLDLALDESEGSSIYSLTRVQNTNVIERFDLLSNSTGYFMAAHWSPESPRDDSRASIGAIATDSSGNVYIADSQLNRIQKYAPNGTQITKWGISGSKPGEFVSPVGIAIDAEQNVYVVEADNHRVQKFTSNGTFVSEWGGGPVEYASEKGHLAYPNSIDIDSNGRVFVSDISNRRISIFSQNGQYITEWNATDVPFDVPGNWFSDKGFHEAGKLAIDSQDNVYVVDARNIFEPPFTYVRIAKFSPAGELIASWQSYGTSEPLLTVSSIAVDDKDNVLVSSYDNGTIAQFSSAGLLLTRWGSTGPDSGSFSYPLAIATSHSGLVYIGDSNTRIQVFAPESTALNMDLAPKLVVPSAVTVNATDSNIRTMNVTYEVTAVDDKDLQSDIRIKCTPLSGSPFFVGLGMRVTCYATDTQGNASEKSFVVTVNPAPQEPEKLPPALEHYRFEKKWGHRIDNALLYPYKLAIDDSGKVYVLSSLVGNYTVQVYNSSGFPIGQLVPYGLDEGQVYSGAGIAVDRAGDNIYLTDSQRAKVLHFDSTGRFVNEWGHAPGNTTDPGNLSTELGEVAVNSAGNVYVVDAGNRMVQVYSPEGEFITAFGSEGSEGGEFSYPRELAIDSNDNIYVSDFDGRLEKFGNHGTFITQWQIGDSQDIATDTDNNIYALGQYGSNTTKYDSTGKVVAILNLTIGDPSLYDPNCISLAPDGSIYTGVNNGGIHKFDANGGYVDTIIFTDPSVGNFRSPYDVALDPTDQYLYVLDDADNRMQKFDTNGTFLAQWTLGGMQSAGATGIDVDSKGNVWVIAGKLLKFSDNGKLLFTSSATSDTGDPFGALYAVAIDRLHDDTIYVADASLFKIYKFDSDGKLLTSWPTGDTGEQSGQSIWPQDLAINSNGNVLVLEAFAERIANHTSAGDFVSYINVSRAAFDKFGSPIHALRIQSDGSDNLYVGYFDGVVRKFSSNGTYLAEISTSGSGDGQVFFPTGIATDPSGTNVYVLDGGNVRLQHFVTDIEVVPEFSQLLFYIALFAGFAVIITSIRTGAFSRFTT